MCAIQNMLSPLCWPLQRWPQLIFPPSASGGAALVCKISGIWLHPDYVKLRQNSGGRYQFLIQFVHSCWLSGHLVSEYWWECHHVTMSSLLTRHTWASPSPTCTVAHWPTTENHCHVELFEGDLILDSKCGENLCNVSIETIYLIVYFLEASCHHIMGITNGTVHQLTHRAVKV